MSVTFRGNRCCAIHDGGPSRLNASLSSQSTHLGLHRVADPFDAVKQLWLNTNFHFFAQFADVDVHDIGPGIELMIPHILNDGHARTHFAAGAHSGVAPELSSPTIFGIPGAKGFAKHGFRREAENDTPEAGAPGFWSSRLFPTSEWHRRLNRADFDTAALRACRSWRFVHPRGSNIVTRSLLCSNERVIEYGTPIGSRSGDEHDYREATVS